MPGGEPVVIRDGRGADEIEVLAQDERVGEFLIDPRLEERGAPPVNGAVAQQRDAETEHGLAIDAGAILVVVRQESGAEAVATVHVAAPERQRLVERGVAGLAVVEAGRRKRGGAVEVQIECAERLPRATVGDVLLDQRGEIGRILRGDAREHFREKQWLFRSERRETDPKGRQQHDECDRTTSEK